VEVNWSSAPIRARKGVYDQSHAAIGVCAKWNSKILSPRWPTHSPNNDTIFSEAGAVAVALCPFNDESWSARVGDGERSQAHPCAGGKWFSEDALFYGSAAAQARIFLSTLHFQALFIPIIASHHSTGKAVMWLRLNLCRSSNSVREWRGKLAKSTLCSAPKREHAIYKCGCNLCDRVDGYLMRLQGHSAFLFTLHIRNVLEKGGHYILI